MTSYSWDDLIQAAGETGFILVDAGTHDLEVIKAEVGKTSNDNPKIKATFKVIGGSQDGKTFSDDFILVLDKPVVMGFFLKKMNAFGLDPAFFASLRDQYPDLIASLPGVAAALVGRRAQGDVEVDTSYFEDGKNKVKVFRALGSAAPTKVTRSTSATPLDGNDIFAAPAPPAPPADDAPLSPPPIPTVF